MDLFWRINGHCLLTSDARWRHNTVPESIRVADLILVWGCKRFWQPLSLPELCPSLKSGRMLQEGLKLRIVSSSRES